MREPAPSTREDPAALAADLRGVALAHAALDELGVPRLDDRQNRLTLLGRLEALRAGRFDPARLCPVCPAGRG